MAKLIVDNHGAERICNHPGSHKRSKHIEVAHLMVRDFIERGYLETYTVNTKENVADGNTKALTEPGFLKFRNSLGIVNVKSVLSGAKLSKDEPNVKRLNWNLRRCQCVCKSESDE